MAPRLDRPPPSRPAMGVALPPGLHQKRRCLPPAAGNLRPPDSRNGLAGPNSARGLRNHLPSLRNTAPKGAAIP